MGILFWHHLPVRDDPLTVERPPKSAINWHEMVAAVRLQSDEDPNGGWWAFTKTDSFGGVDEFELIADQGPPPGASGMIKTWHDRWITAGVGLHNVVDDYSIHIHDVEGADAVFRETTLTPRIVGLTASYRN